ncbi:MAG: hypothetical protein ACJ711_11070 [Ornithinibacter sp.]
MSSLYRRAEAWAERNPTLVALDRIMSGESCWGDVSSLHHWLAFAIMSIVVVAFALALPVAICLALM